MADNRWKYWLIVLSVILEGILLTVVVGWIFSYFSNTLLIALFSGLLAFLLKPAVDGIESRLPSRAAAIALVYLATAAAVGVGGMLLTGPLIRQVIDLTAELPEYVEVLQNALPRWQSLLGEMGIALDFARIQEDLLRQLQSSATAILSNTLSFATGVTSFVTDTVLVFVLSVYWLSAGRRLRRSIHRFVPAPQLQLFLMIEQQINRVFGGYIRGQFTLAVVIGIAAGMGSWLLGVRYAALVGVIAGIFELVPMFGAVLGAVPAIIISLFQPFPLVLYVIALFVVIQQVEGQYLAPRISGRAVGVPPVVALLSLIAGFEVGGLLGAIIAVPAAGLIVSLALAFLDKSGQDPPLR